jgi:CubicO group peptidase (beta-lactamase class C family)
MAGVDGFVEQGWERVADVFRAGLEDGSDLGAACCVYVDGRVVVDLWGGLADGETNRPWERDTVALVASTTKGATALCAHLLVERGELDLDAPVTRYWPEFGAAGSDFGDLPRPSIPCSGQRHSAIPAAEGRWGLPIPSPGSASATFRIAGRPP